MASHRQTFIHLHVHSAYSLAEGSIPVEELTQMCVRSKMPAVAVTDTNNLFGAMEFALKAAKSGVQPIFGAQMNIAFSSDGDADIQQIVLIVQNDQGYRNLCTLLAEAYLHQESTASPHITYNTLYKHTDGLIALSGGVKGHLGQLLLHGQADKAEELCTELITAFGDRFYIELQRHGLTEEEQVEERLIDLAYKYDVPLVATNDAYFPQREGYEAHDALLCIAEGRYITEKDRRKVTPEHYFKSSREMVDLFRDLPETIQNTVVIAQRCSFLLKPIDPILPPFSTEGGRSEFEELKAQAEEGLRWRLSNFVLKGKENEDISEPYFERLSYELDIIKGMGFPGYFLIVSDFIKWAKDKNIPVGPGRGSGAGSVVAWALKITDLDPIKLGLLFERFLNPERVSMPDFDIDFCQDRRDEVIRYVQEKYGYDHVAQIITFGKLQARAVVRDVGRVLQMSYGQVDRIAKMIPNNPANPTTLQEALNQDEELRKERYKDDTQKKLIDIALQLEGMYRHASTHAAGVVIGDRPLHALIPLYRDPRSDMPVTGFNMKYVEQAGLVKFDFLGLKTMTVVQKTVELVNAKNKEQIDILKVPLDDQSAYEMMASGMTVGIFQLESAGMRDTLRKMKPNRFEDIIALVSLYRPGPMDNIPKYIAVKEGKEKADYLHPKLKPFLEETYGIMIYQEQVMQAAQELAGYTLGGADLLRRAMGKKIIAEMDAQREKFIKGAKEHNDVPEEQANTIFDQIAKFAGYGFNKSHAAAYALIAYWTAWLKAHHPLEFMAASMTLDLGNTDKLSVFKQELDRMGIALLPPDINKSFAEFVVEGEGIRYALAALKGVGEQAMQTLVKERQDNGVFKSVADFAERLDYKSMNKRQMEQLASAGAFISLNPNRAQVVAGADIILRYAQSLEQERESGQVSLFGGGDDGDNGLGMPELPDVPKWPSLEQLGKEFSAVGFYLSAHPLDNRQAQFENLKILGIADVIKDMEHKAAGSYSIAGVVLKKQEKVSAKGNKYAFLQLSDPSGVSEVTLFSDLLHETREILTPGSLLFLKVDAEVREGQMRMTARSIRDLDEALDGKIQKIKIALSSSAPADKIRDILTEHGRSDIILEVAIDAERTAHLKLQGRWSLNAEHRNLLRELDGVDSIRES